MVRKTSEMVEAGILAAVAVLFAILGAYLPVLGALFNLLWPVPVAVCGMRNGLRWSVMTLIVAGAVIGSLLGPLQSLSIMAMFGLMGLVLGECLHRGYRPVKTLLFSSVATLISIILSIGLGMLVLGTDPVNLMFEGMEQAMQESTVYYREAGMSEEQIAAAVKDNQNLLATIRLILPGSLVVCSPILAFANYMAARKILGKMGVAFEPLLPFTHWRVPEYFIWPYGLSVMVVSFWRDAPQLVFDLAMNLQMVVSVVFFVQGLAVVYWWLNKSQKPQWWGTIAVILAFAVQVFSIIIVLLGAFESVFDYRKLKERSL